MATQMPTLGARIRRARERARLSQEELAERVGASVRAVGDWENDRRKPRNRLGALEEVLGVALDGEPPPRPQISRRLYEEIMSDESLTPRERQAIVEAANETLATERGAWGPSAPAS